MKLTKILATCFAASTVLFSTIATAVPPHMPDLVRDGNRWTITYYNDSGAGHPQWATQGLCFYYAGTTGTHQRYIWVSDTYPDWNGRATQEGDQIFMHGDFQWPFGKRDGGHDGMEWEIVTSSPRNEGAGHWKEWVEDGRYGITIGFGNAKFRRVGKCEKPGFETLQKALDASYELPHQRDEKTGELLTNPMGVNSQLIK